MLIDKLMANDIKCIDLCPTELDITLPTRVDIANAYQRLYGDTVVISLHSNAGGGTGFEIWTSPNQTRSDSFAQVLGEQLIADFPEISFRADLGPDGDLDKESLFYILKWTHAPAILPECLFFDNYDDVKLLMDPDFRNDYVNSLVRFILKAEQMNL
jgi:N-acetylmuramoyl-L-alanine amidase